MITLNIGTTSVNILGWGGGYSPPKKLLTLNNQRGLISKSKRDIFCEAKS